MNFNSVLHDINEQAEALGFRALTAADVKAEELVRSAANRISGVERKALRRICETHQLDVIFLHGHPYSIEGRVLGADKWVQLKQFVAYVISGARRVDQSQTALEMVLDDGVTDTLLAKAAPTTLTRDAAWTLVREGAVKQGFRIGKVPEGNAVLLVKLASKVGINARLRGNVVLFDGKPVQ